MKDAGRAASGPLNTIKTDFCNMAYSWFATRLRALGSVAALSLTALATMPSAAHAASITLYSAQHEQVVNLLVLRAV